MERNAQSKGNAQMILISQAIVTSCIINFAGSFNKPKDQQRPMIWYWELSTGRLDSPGSSRLYPM